MHYSIYGKLVQRSSNYEQYVMLIEWSLGCVQCVLFLTEVTNDFNVFIYCINEKACITVQPH